MPWQDWVISVGNLIFAFALVPSVLGKDKPSAWTSLVTSLVLFVFGFTFYTLGLIYSAVVVVVTAVMWGVLYLQKIKQTRS